MAPRIERFEHGNHHQIRVRDKPFFALAAELNNSSLSSSHYMNGVWSRLKDQGFNTLLGAVTWDQIEPKEGDFDFAELDRVIEDARGHDLHLVLLWFGSFKNGKSAEVADMIVLYRLRLVFLPTGQSSYAPSWVKTDDKRFPRARINKDGKLQVREVLSVFDQASIDADRKAFAALMKHVKEMDEQHETVIMVQVENEVGLLGDSRDRGESAERAFKSAVPAELVSRLDAEREELNEEIKSNLAHFRKVSDRDGKTWEELFGKSLQTDELFMAYHYAKYVEQVAAVGKAEYDIPHYANAWLRNLDGAPGSNTTVSDGTDPGQYPCGGPIEPVLDIWHMFAPSLDFLAPDIYMPNYTMTCKNYKHRGQPLFIPEQRGDTFGCIRMWEAIGSYGALASSPFGIDCLPDDMSSCKKHMQIMQRVSPFILEARRKDSPMAGFFFDEFAPGSKDPSPEREFTFGNWKLTVSRAHVFGHPEAGFGIIIQVDADRFILLGQGFHVKFESTSPKSTYTGILSFTEKQIDPKTAELKTIRLLNGDETRSGTIAVMPSENPDYADVPVAILIPAATSIAEVQVYSLGG